MKKSIYDQSEPRDNMVMAALKQAVSNLKATNSMTGQTGSIAKTKQIGSSAKTEANPLRLAQQEKLFSSANATPILGGIQKTDAEIAASKLPSDFPASQWEKMKPREQQRLLSKTNLTPQEQWSLLNIDPLQVKKLVGQERTNNSYANIINATQKMSGDFTGSDAETLKDEQNALRKWNAQMKQTTNAYKGADVKTLHKEQNELSEQDPITFTIIEQPYQNADAETMHDEQKIINIASEANKALDKLLTSINLDLGNLTPLAKSYIAYARLKITNYAIDGKLTQYILDNIIYDTADSIARNVTPPPGTSYIQLIRQKNPQEVIPEIGTLKTEVLNEEEWEQLKANTNAKYKQDVYNEAVNEYRYALNNGTAWLSDFQAYYDQAALKYYNNCVKPVYLRKDKNGNGIGERVPIGELVPPNDNSFGAQLVKEAIQLVGLGYNKPAGQGNEPGIKIDCQGLVRWAIAQINPEWGKYGIGKGARYQIDDTRCAWNIDEGKPITEDDLKIGNTLFWRGDESGEIKHTAIYIGKVNKVDLMIEAAGGSVRIVPLRKQTDNPDGEDSTLCQINQMLPERLEENVSEYLQTNNG